MVRITKNTGKLLVIVLLLGFCAWFFGARSGGELRVLQTDSSSLKQQLSQAADTVIPDHVQVTKPQPVLPSKTETALKSVNGVGPADIVAFAKTLRGVPYVYASSDPNVGFDCSGFITYVFKHFNIEVPRSSIDFTNIGETIEPLKAKQGDLVLFTGTNDLERYVGHMGIIVSNSATGGLQFIHATSGKAMSVTISEMSERYRKRFIRVCRIL